MPQRGDRAATEGHVERVISAGLRRHEAVFAAEIVGDLGPAGCARLQVLLTSEGLLAEVKSDPGPLGLDTLLGEIAKLKTVRTLKLPENLFAEKPDRLVVAWRSRAARMFPSDFLDCPERLLVSGRDWSNSRQTVPAAQRQTGITYRATSQ